MSIKKSPARMAIKKARGEAMTFGKMIESLRVCDEFTQAQMARRLGISRAHLCDIEKGRRVVTPEKAAAFADALGYSKNQFVAQAIEDSLRRIGLRLKVAIRAA
jgi:transcriptional regulator with XRE-family HTH domain